MIKDDTVILSHIRDSIAAIHEYTKEGCAVFMEDRKTQDATIRQLEIIGEAVKSLSLEFREIHRDIPWRSIAGMRDLLIHHYFGIDVRMVWNVIEQHLPTLESVVTSTLKNTLHE